MRLPIGALSGEEEGWRKAASVHRKDTSISMAYCQMGGFVRIAFVWNWMNHKRDAAQARRNSRNRLGTSHGSIPIGCAMPTRSFPDGTASPPPPIDGDCHLAECGFWYFGPRLQHLTSFAGSSRPW